MTLPTPGTPDTLATMNLAKVQYAKGIEEYSKAPAILRKSIPFDESMPLGQTYNKAVLLRNETGFTTGGAGALSYNPVQPMAIAQAVIDAVQMLLVSRVSLDAVLRTRKGDKQAIERVTTIALKNMIDSADLRLESSILYGLTGIATFASAQSLTSTTALLTVNANEWAAGLFTANEGAALDFTAPGAPTTLINTNTVSPTNTTYPVLASVNSSQKTLTIQATSGDITAIVAAINTGAAAQAPVTLFWGGTSPAGFDQIGLVSIFTNVGVLFGIDASQFNLWQGNPINLQGAAMTFATLNKVVGQVAERGMGTEKLSVYFNPQIWAGCMNDQAALRRYDGSYSSKKLSNGATSLEFHTQTGDLEIVSHPLVKQGYTFVVPDDRMSRVGSVDWDFEMRIVEGKEGVFEPLQTGTSYQAVRYTSQQVFCAMPACSALVTNFVAAP